MLQVAYKNNFHGGQNTIPPIVRVLSYFSLFSYPLLPSEIGQYLPPGVEYENLDEELATLECQGYICRVDEFYSILSDPGLAGF